MKRITGWCVCCTQESDRIDPQDWNDHNIIASRRDIRMQIKQF